VNNLFRTVGILAPDDSFQLLYNEFAIHLAMLYGYLPYMILPLYSSIEKLDFRLLEAAADLGANRTQSFLRVTLPLTAPGIVAGSILCFVPALGDFITPDLVGGARTIMIGNLVETQFLSARDWPFGSALSFILMAVVLASLMLYIRVSGTDDSRQNR
jgi:spermidine/putrescine transport system permease protein